MRTLLAPLLVVISSCGSGGGGATIANLLFVDVALAAQLLFTGTVGPVFDAVTEVHMVHMQRIMGNGAAVGDYDGDGDLDLYLLGHNGQPNRLFRNELVTRTFTDVTPPELADTGLGRVAHFVDLDNDGDLDLLVINDDDGGATVSPSRIYRNNGNATFTDVSAGSGFRPLGYLHCGCAIADYDRDGLLDIYVTVWRYERGTGTPGFPGENVLYRNLGGMQFADTTAAAGLGGLARDSFTAIFTDFDDDGWPDLYVAVDHTSDEFYFNVNGTFVNDTVAVGLTHTGNDMGVACADIDDDGDLDLYVTNITDPSGGTGTLQRNVFYLNDQNVIGRPRFRDFSVSRGVTDTYFGWGTEFFDADQDGDLDIAAVSGFDEWVLAFKGPGSPVYRTPSVLFINDGTTRFTRVTGAGLDDPDDGRGLIAFDYDRDGDLDLLTTNVAQPVRLLENRTTPMGHWLGVALSPDNRAIGARVYATIGAVTKRRDVIAGRSYLAGTPSEVHFGLGGATTVDTLRIEWADGTVQTLTDVPVDRMLRLVAP